MPSSLVTNITGFDIYVDQFWYL